MDILEATPLFQILFQGIPQPPSRLYDDDEDNGDAAFILYVQNLLLSLSTPEVHVRIANYINVVQGYSDTDFIVHFRLSRTIAYELVERFEVCDVYKILKDSAGRKPKSAETHILTFLWYAGHQTSSYRDVSDRFNMTISALYNIISRVIKFLCSIGETIIRLPKNAEKTETAQHFLMTYKFPGVIGCLDGSHIRINKPHHDGDSYINRKKYFSLHLQGLVNHERKFIHVHIGFPGRVHDARVFRESDLPAILPDLCSSS